MLLYRPRFRHPDEAAKPPNLGAALALSLYGAVLAEGIIPVDDAVAVLD